ncbi:ABC transporter ATP-binding protein, partial [Amycolatopsis rhizosphaerae]
METTGVVGAAVTARGLGVRGPRGPVFENVDLEVPAGGFLVVHGPGGSGRTSLLLALSGRLRLTA